MKRSISCGIGTRAQIKCIETNITYPSIQAAADITGISRHAISRCLRGAQKTAGGFSWEYALLKDTLCWSCKNAYGNGKCSWASRDLITGKLQFKPVPGWEAKKTKVRHSGKDAASYLVIRCPLYDPDER